MKQALATYTESGGQGDPTFDTAQAIAVMLEKHGIACDLLHGFDWGKWTTGTPVERLALIPAGQEHVLNQEDGKKRFVQAVTELSRAFALCAASDEAANIRDDVSFVQAIQAALSKQNTRNGKTPEQIDAAIRQLVSSAITTDGQVIDVFTAAGLPKPDISILSDQFLAEVRGLKHKNVAAELLEKLLKDEIRVRAKRHLVQAHLFSPEDKRRPQIERRTARFAAAPKGGGANRGQPDRLPRFLPPHAGAQPLLANDQFRAGSDEVPVDVAQRHRPGTR